MGLKRKTKLTDSFSMASMTDVIFLLLIFFLVTSTIIVPNIIKVSLPSASASSPGDNKSARIIITKDSEFYIGLEKAAETQCSVDSLELILGAYAVDNPSGYVSIHADEEVPYSAIVRAINATASARLKVVLATKVSPHNTN